MAIDITRMHQNLLNEITDANELLRKEIEEDIQKASAREQNYEFLKLILEQPDLYPRSYEQILSQIFRIPSEVFHIEKQLRISNLLSVERRRRLERIMKEIGLSTFNLIVGKSANPEHDFDDVAKIVRHRDFRWRTIEGKTFLISLSILFIKKEEVSQNPGLEAIKNILDSVTRRGSYKLCGETATRIVDILGAEYGFTKRRTSAERVQDILVNIEDNHDIDDMRTTLLIVQRELSHLKDEFDEQLQNSNQEFIREFFARMNSARYSYLLDTIAQTDALIGEMQRNGWVMDPKLQAVPIVIQIFMNLLRSQGVVPIEQVGAEKEVLGSQISFYEFIGSMNFGSDDKLKVHVRTPGWKIGESIISKPRVEMIDCVTSI